MSVLAIVLVALVVAATLAYLLLGRGHGPLNSVERSADQHNRVSPLGKPLRFQGDFERPRDEGGRPRGV